MVKLIAADMDGTLLDDQKRLPNGFPKLLECLAKRGVAFAVASGRSYPALQMLFGKKTSSLKLYSKSPNFASNILAWASNF